MFYKFNYINMNTNIYLMRHFERIDDSGSIDIDIKSKWDLLDSKNSIFIHNPYLSDKATQSKNINKVISQITNIKDIDIIITSPFLRCLQTSLIMMNNINQIDNQQNKIENVYVDFGLCEFINEDSFNDINLPYDICNIYNNSIDYLKENNIETPFIIFNDNPTNFDEYENDLNYKKRIESTIKNISKNFRDKNILIVSHAYSYMIIEKNKTFDYYQVEKINNYQDNYKNKYIKYKTKYLELKQKYKLDVNNTYFDELNRFYPKCILNRKETNKSTETYGEMEYNGIKEINYELNKNNKIKYFIDIGSGRGKLTCWFAGIPNIIKSYGIEIVEKRHNDALELKEKLSKNYPLITKKIDFKCIDISNINLGELTNNSNDNLIWISNLCFGLELSNKIFTQILNQMEIGTIIACSKKPFENNQDNKISNKNLKLIKELKIPMSWTKLSNVYVYQIILAN